jgi:hypothetical protein
MQLHDINPDRLLGDKGYDSDDIRNDLADRGIEPVITPRSNRKTPIEYDREAYKRRLPHGSVLCLGRRRQEASRVCCVCLVGPFPWHLVLGLASSFAEVTRVN